MYPLCLLLYCFYSGVLFRVVEKYLLHVSIMFIIMLFIMLFIFTKRINSK